MEDSVEIKKFEDLLRSQCQLAYANLKNGERSKKLDKRTNSLIDIVYIGRTNSCKFQHSCTVSFGNVIEKTAMDYAEIMGYETLKKKTLLASKIDILFRIDMKVYNLESKVNIELDNEKSKKALDSLQRKHKAVFNSLNCQDKNWQLISKFVVWTKEDAIEASLTAKKPIMEKDLMGFKDFFALFKVDISKDEFFAMLQRVWIEEVEAYWK